MTTNDNARKPSFWRSFGPGVLFAGAAIGTSHFVQSTRAGALFGLGLVVVVVFANFIKYPAYRFGPLYAAATGNSLITGYRALGRWVLALYLLSEIAVIAIVIAASALVTAAILLAITGIQVDTRYVGVAFIASGALVLTLGGYRLLDRLSKLFVFVLTLTTLAATLLSLGRIEWSLAQFVFPDLDIRTYAFIIALMGFMPAGMELSVVQSLWCVAKSKASGQPSSVPHTLLDFNIGYLGSAFLAVCFLLMGAGVMHSQGVVPESQAAGFANQVIALYTTNLGEWAGAVVGAAALFVMFTTLISVLDGLPRLVSASILALRQEHVEQTELERSPVLLITTCVLAAGGALILLFFMQNFQSFIDFVTTTAFVIAPFTALLNHLVVLSPDVPLEHRPGKSMRLWSLLGIVTLSGLAIAFLVWRMTG